ncbi:MAG: MFS transporter [Clostridia bacterium]|nr:MFS transporter [Clostridia bacterium]
MPDSSDTGVASQPLHAPKEKRQLNPNAITAFLMLGYTLIYMDKTVIGTAIVPIATQFHLTSFQTGLFVSLFFIGYSIMQIPFGFIADHVGYKPVLIFSLSSCTLFTLLFGLVGTFPLFLIVRFMTGVGDAGYPSSSAKSIALNYPQEKRPFAQSLLLSTGGIGGLLAAVIGVSMIGHLGWQSIYYLLSGFFALALLGIILFLPNKRPAVRGSGTQGGEKIRFSEVIRNVNVWILFFAMMSYNIVIYSLNTWMPTFLVDVFHKKIAQLTPVIGAAAILGIIGALLAGKLFGWFAGREKPMLITAAGILAALLTIASVVHSYALVCTLLICSLFFCETIFTGLFTWPHKIMKKEIIGSSIGFVNTGGTLGGAIGPALFGYVIGISAGSFVPTFVGMGGFALLAGLLALLVRNKRVIG